MMKNIDHIECVMTLECNEHSLISTVTLTNTQKRSYFIDTLLLPQKKMKKRLFSVLDKTGEPVPYLGVLMKPVQNIESFYELGSGCSVTIDVELNKYYQIKSGKSYTVRYSAYNSLHPSCNEIHKITSDFVTMMCD